MASQENRIGRRQFLGRSVGATVGFGCFTTDEMKGVLAAAQRSKKPVLNDAQLNAWFERRENPRQRFADRLRRDPVSALADHFEMTERQRRNLDSLPSESRNALADAIERAIKERKRIRFGCDRPERRAQVAYAVTPRFTSNELIIEVQGDVR